jgi:acetyl-CoA C-acetyltransferase
MAALVIRRLLERQANFDPAQLEDVIFGAANQAGEDNRDVARMALLLADLPEHIGGVTVNRLCASSLQSIADAARHIRCGEGEAFLAGGVESMSRAPFVMAKAETAYDRRVEMHDTSLGWRFVNPQLAEKHTPYSMGETAENVAQKWNVSREDQDRFALQSQQRWADAYAAGRFADEVTPVEVPQGRKKPPVVVERDEHPRETTLEKLAKLRPVFREGGSVTAGNSSGVNDGAAVTLVAEETFARKAGLQPMARIVSAATAGVDPAYMGIGPIPATRKALQRAGLSVNELDLVELNEAFASQSLVCIRELGLDPDKVNVNGGAIAIGHPLGCSGARLSTTLLHEMKRRPGVRYGLATMCVGVGQGAAVIYERLA